MHGRTLKADQKLNRHVQSKNNSMERPQQIRYDNQEMNAGFYYSVGSYPGNGVIKHQRQKELEDFQFNQQVMAP